MSTKDRSSNWVLMTVKLKDEDPNLDQVSDVLGIPVSELDEAFGVIAVDRQQGLFAVQIRENAIVDIKGSEDCDVNGPFSNVRIEPLK
jgi:hypothetical protein